MLHRKDAKILAQHSGRLLVYLASSRLRKEDFTRNIAEQEGISEGLVCVLTAVEPCRTFTVGPSRKAKKLELRSFTGKCLHQYFYLIDPRLGWSTSGCRPDCRLLCMW
jgi:hypothetical protein